MIYIFLDKRKVSHSICYSFLICAPVGVCKFRLKFPETSDNERVFELPGLGRLIPWANNAGWLRYSQTSHSSYFAQLRYIFRVMINWMLANHEWTLCINFWVGKRSLKNWTFYVYSVKHSGAKRTWFLNFNESFSCARLKIDTNDQFFSRSFRHWTRWKFHCIVFRTTFNDRCNIH